MFLAARRVSLCVLFLVPLFTAKLNSFEIFLAAFEKSSKFVCLDHHFRRFGQRITHNNVSRAFSATISVPASFAVPASQSSSSSSSASPVAVATAAGALGANERAFQRFGYRYQLLSFVYVLYYFLRRLTTRTILREREQLLFASSSLSSSSFCLLRARS